MTRYEGLDPHLRTVVLARDNHRCRWCGRTNWGVDLHHIRYRRGFVDDVKENLIALCRFCHNFVHGTPSTNGDTIHKAEAQEILYALIDMPGVTGMALRRQLNRTEKIVICVPCRKQDHVNCEGCNCQHRTPPEPEPATGPASE